MCIVIHVREGISLPQMTTSFCRCSTVTCFIKPPIGYILSESLVIADSDYYLI